MWFVLKLKKYSKIMLAVILVSVIFVWVSCYFNECTLMEAYSNESVRPFFILAVIADLYVFLTFAAVLGFGLCKLPKLPGGPWAKEQLIVCRYSDISYGFIFVLCIGLACGMYYGAWINYTEPSEWNWIQAVLVLGGMATMFLGLAVVFALYMANYVVVFFPEGVVCSNIFRQTTYIPDEQVQYVSVIPAYERRSLRLQTLKKAIWLNHFCSNYYEAENYLTRRYPDFETYRKEE